ncbi:MAG: hypothetical protein M3O50_21265 [Myxococcota bacterium]|nr:hypothetical protein [Myxococcota bacterium]
MSFARAFLVAAAVVSGVAGCADVLGVGLLTERGDGAVEASDDATSPDGSAGFGDDATLHDADGQADARVRGDGGEVDDRTVPADASDEKMLRPDVLACPSAQLIGIDTTNATRAVSASGIDTYTFTLPQASDVLVRVRTGSSTADVAVGTGCDGSSPILPPSRVAMNGAYTRGRLAAGTYYATITWDATMLPGSAYSFDVLRDAPAANAACAQATPLTPAAAIMGRTFDANDAAPGCRGSTPYGELFYSLTLPANAAWQITATASPPIWSPWTLVLQAFSSCTSTTCAVPAAVSEKPGSPASLALQNASGAPQTFLLGVSAGADDAVTGGGGFVLTASVTATCLGEGTSCATGTGTGICCMGHCQATATQNSCGHACGIECPFVGAVCTNGACACPSSAPSSCPTSGLPACTNTMTDPNNCSPSGTCGTVCTNTDPHAQPAVSCKNGLCSTVCLAGYTHCGKLCTDLQNDAAHCGKCSGTGAVCPAGETCQGGHCACPSALKPNYCAGACTNISSDNANCGACGARCPAAETCQNGHCACPTLPKPDFCAGVCTDVQSDRSNCGACGAPCPAAESCVSGVCRCTLPGNPTYCAPSCTNTQTDNANCGACTNACTGGQSCNRGTCACPAGMPSLCAGACTSTATDNANCGACGVACVGGQCAGGTCTCAAPNGTLCGNTCTNTTTDRANCGACGVPCAAPLTCQGGTCGCPASSPFACGATCCPPTADGGAPLCLLGICF